MGKQLKFRDKVCRVKTSGRLTATQLSAMQAELSQLLKSKDRISILHDLRGLKSFELKALMLEVKFLMVNFSYLKRKLKKYALVSDSYLGRLGAVFALVAGIEFQQFQSDKAADKWLKA